MPKLQFTPQIWFLVAFLAYAIPTAVVYFLFLNPLFSEVGQARTDSMATETYMILKNTATQLAQFKQRIAGRNDLALMRSSLDSVAVHTDVKIVSVTADTAVERLNSGFLVRKYTITIEGHYLQANDFITGLEQKNNYYAVTDLTVERIDDSTGKARAQFTIRVLTVPTQEKVAAPPEEQKTGANSQGLAPAQSTRSG